jgi:hypothetical protein
MMRAAYKDGAEYMVRVNDDSEFVSSNWVSKGVSKLASYVPPNVGMVGPNCLEGNTAIMTHDMVHRTHLDIFEHYYPDVFSAWWIDDWISKVYGPKRSTKIMDWRVKHHVRKYGTRYKVQHGEAKFLKGELKKGATRINQWLLSREDEVKKADISLKSPNNVDSNRTVVIAAAINYRISDFKNYILPLRKVYTGDVVLFVNSNLPNDVVELCKQYNIFTRPLPSGSRLGVKGNRYIGYSEVCNGYRLCFATDFRDVFFQANPFQDVPIADLILFEEHRRKTIGTCKYNSDWIRSCWGKTFLASISSKPIICSGTIMGTPRGFAQLKDEMLSEMSITKDLKCSARDQGHLNYLYYNHKIKASVQKHGYGIVNTVGYDTRINVRKYARAGAVLQNDGSVSPVVHQYDRFGELKQMLKTLISKIEASNAPIKSWTVVVTLSIGFDDMFTNWWFHYSKLNLDMDVIMIAEDRPTYDKYSSIPGIEVWNAEYEDSKDTKSLTYNTVQYKKLVSRRASHILRVLDSKPNIIYTDIDTVWLQDPRPYFAGKFDIWAQLDDTNYYCTGFMAIIKSDKVVHFLKDWNDQLRKKPQLNQPIFNKILHKSRLKHKALPLREFPSGKLYFQQKRRDGVVIVHNNFIIGKDKKIDRFKDIGLWSTNAPSINAPHLRENYCLDFEHSSMVYKDVVWQTPKQLCVINIQKATILKSGLLFNATSAYTFGKWYWKKHTSEKSTSSTFSKKSFVSFVQIWQNVMQHITFDTYPKSRLLCPYLQRNPEIGILVMNNLQRDLIIESCSLPIHRFKNVDKSISAASIAATVWPGDFKMGIVPFNSFTSLGSQTKKGDKVIYIPRKVGTKRSVKNEKDVLELLRRYFGNKLRIYYPKNDWRADRKIFEQASVIIGPHGGAMANMIFAPVDTTIIEFLPLTRLRSKGENERPCYFGLARGLGFDYHSVEPLHFDFEKPMTVPLLDLEKTLARIQPNRNDCALLFFGLAKHFNDIVLPSIQKYILDMNPDCDIYAHTYDIKEITNPRNNEKNSPVNPLEVYSMTKNVVLDTLDSVSKVRDFKYYRRFRQSGGLHPYSMDNMIKQWHSIDRVWRYANQEHDYKRYGLFRLDVRFAEPIDITNGDAVIASFHPDRGLNDRGFYGLYKWAKIWATKRFEQVEAQARRNHNDLNAESFMKYLMRDVPVELKSMCFNRVRATGEIKRDCKPIVQKVPEPKIPVSKTYHSSKWEQLWLDNIKIWQNHQICEALLKQKEQVHAFMKDTCSATTNTDWCLIDDSVHSVWYNTKNGQVVTRKPQSVTTISPMKKMTPKDDSLWSYFEFPNGEREYIEPLVSHLRHPLARCLFGDTFLVDRSYVLPGNSGLSKTYLFDAGASHWSQGAGGPSLSYFTTVWKRYGFNWAHIEAWEGGTTVAKFKRTVPREWRSRTHFHQQWISTSPEKQPFVPDVIQDIVTKEDYVVFKLDIDSKAVETAIVDYLLVHPEALEYIDEFVWEQHVDNYIMAPNWKKTQDMTKSIADSYEYFLKLRKLGVRAHSWV